MKNPPTATEIADAIVKDWVIAHNLDPKNMTEEEATDMMWRMVLLTEYPLARARAYISAALRRFRQTNLTR